MDLSNLANSTVETSITDSPSNETTETTTTTTTTATTTTATNDSVVVNISSTQPSTPNPKSNVKFAEVATTYHEEDVEEDGENDNTNGSTTTTTTTNRKKSTTTATTVPLKTENSTAGSKMLLSSYSHAKNTNTDSSLYQEQPNSVSKDLNDDPDNNNNNNRDDSMTRMSMALQKSVLPFTLTMEELSYSIDVVTNNTLKDKLAGRKKQVTRKFLLKGITGVLRPKTMTALMGPSGAGKSTLLDVLAGRKNTGFIEGALLINNKPRGHDFKRMCGYVEQRDILLGTLTVKELLYYTAKLRLPSTYSDEACEKRAIEVMKQLGILGCSDVLVGDENHRGISGGQAKRVNIGMELITCPSILFLDEPTSGLDATTALDVMRVVRKIRDDGTTVVCTIHQPSTDIFLLFDRLMLLVGGEVVYLGLASSAVNYFVDLGFKYNEGYNPAEFMVAVTSDNPGGNSSVEGPVVAKGFFASHYQQSALAELRKVSTKRAQDSFATQELTEEQPLFVNNAMYNFKTLVERNYKKMSRDPSFLKNRIFVPTFVALLFLLVYRDSPYTKEGIRNRQALMMLTVTFFTIGANSLLGGLIGDRLFFTRERNAASYQVSSYFAALIGLELPFMALKGLFWSVIIYFGCNFARTADQFFFFMFVVILLADFGNGLAQLFSALFNRLEPAAAAMTTLPLLFIIFSGFFIFPSSMPEAWRYTVYYMSYCNYALAALIFNEFGSATDFTTTGYFCFNNYTMPLDVSCPVGLTGCSMETVPLTSAQILTSLGAPTGFFSSRFTNLMLLILIWFVLRVLGYLGLRFVRHGSR